MNEKAKIVEFDPNELYALELRRKRLRLREALDAVEKVNDELVQANEVDIAPVVLETNGIEFVVTWLAEAIFDSEIDLENDNDEASGRVEATVRDAMKRRVEQLSGVKLAA